MTKEDLVENKVNYAFYELDIVEEDLKKSLEAIKMIREQLSKLLLPQEKNEQNN